MALLRHDLHLIPRTTVREQSFQFVGLRHRNYIVFCAVKHERGRHIGRNMLFPTRRNAAGEFNNEAQSGISQSEGYSQISSQRNAEDSYALFVYSGPRTQIRHSIFQRPQPFRKMVPVEDGLRGRSRCAGFVEIVWRINAQAKCAQPRSEMIEPVGSRPARSVNDEQRRMWLLTSRFVAFEPDILRAAFITIHLSKDAARGSPVAQSADRQAHPNAKDVSRRADSIGGQCQINLTT